MRAPAARQSGTTPAASPRAALLFALALASLAGGCAGLASRTYYDDQSLYGYREDPYFDATQPTRFPLQAALVVSDTVRKERAYFQPCMLDLEVPVGKVAALNVEGVLKNWFEKVKVVQRAEDAADAEFLLELGLPRVRVARAGKETCDAGAMIGKALFGVFSLGLGFLVGPDPKLQVEVDQAYRVLRAPSSEEWKKLAGSRRASGSGVSDGFGVYFGSSTAAAQQAFDRAMREMLRQFSAPFRRDRQGLLAAARTHRLESGASPAVSLPQWSVAEVPAFGDPPREHDYAVVIGVEQYLNDLPPAEFAAADAQLVRRYLLEMGYRTQNIELLVNARATHANLRRTFESWLPNQVTEQSRVFVYYAGHGAADPANGKAHFVPYDGDPAYLGDTGYPVGRLYEGLAALKIASATVVLDACFSGRGGRSVAMRGARPLVMVNEQGPAAAHVAALVSSGANQIAVVSPKQRHGLFTYHFLRALKEGHRELGAIYDAVYPAVEADARRMNVQQTPELLPSVAAVRGRFVLRP